MHKFILFLFDRDAGHKCPIDNEILLENQLFPDNFAKREILSLKVKCPNKGCSQKMELRHLEVSFNVYFILRIKVQFYIILISIFSIYTKRYLGYAKQQLLKEMDERVKSVTLK